MAAQSRGSVKVFVQPENDSLDAIVTEFLPAQRSLWMRHHPTIPHPARSVDAAVQPLHGVRHSGSPLLSTGGLRRSRP